MNKEKLNDILIKLQNGNGTQQEIEAAAEQIRALTFSDMGYAKIDLHRENRTGSNEVIYGEGKTTEQIIGILDKMKESGEKNVLITRVSPEKIIEIKKKYPLKYDELSRVAVFGEDNVPSGHGVIIVVTAGTSDLPVAREAMLTAKFLGNDTRLICDVGVAGIHRLLSCEEEIKSASVVIAVAGMEGALASVIGGLTKAPVIAVPTSVGYGASFEGLSALLCMLNSCASGVSVVNIDNGFGAGFMAHSINHVGI